MNRSEQFIYIIGAGFAGQMIAAENKKETYHDKL